MYNRIVSNFIESARDRFQEWRRQREILQDPAAVFVLGEYRNHGGVILGEEEDLYRLKVTPDGMEIIPQDGGEFARANPEAEINKIQNWIEGYSVQAMYVQRYLRVALGLPPDISEKTKDQK